MNNYEDIINHERHIVTRPKMSLYNRAAQFASFKALTGYDECIKKANKTTNKPIILDNDAKEQLDKKIHQIEKHLKENPIVTITYFIKDNQKQSGIYDTKTNSIKKIDKINNIIYLMDNTKINIENIIEINTNL